MKDDILLEMKGIQKTFLSIKALKGVDFVVKYGEVHALMGENGAGKSTLIKVLTGIHQKDTGEIKLEGKSIEPHTALQAQKLGISTIYQEINLIPYLSVSENIFLGREPKKNGVIDWKKMHTDTYNMLKDLKLEIDVKKPLNQYSTALQQMISIARAISINTKLVVMDEPTSSLDELEVNVLFDIIKRLRDKNISVIYISHKLDEIFKICDKATVLKDGELVGEYNVNSLTKLDLISKMIGRDASSIVGYKKSSGIKTDEVICKIRNIKSGNKLKGIDLEIKKGEVLGLAGLLGSGRTEIAKVIFGDDATYEGEIEISGKPVRFKLPRDAIKKSIAYCSEDRKVEGILPHMSIRENIIMAILPKLCKLGFVSKKKEKAIVEEYINNLGIKTPSPEQEIRNLSGGNQQKVILSRWLCMNPQLVILDEPTRGIDVGAKAEIEMLIQKMAENGIGILMISSEIDELIRNCDRIIVIREGKKVGELGDDEITENNIMKAIASGHDLLAG